MFGQYEGYHDVVGVEAGSTTETYAAIRLSLDNWRWSGVPIVIRAGKTLAVSATEVSVSDAGTVEIQRNQIARQLVRESEHLATTAPLATLVL